MTPRLRKALEVWLEWAYRAYPRGWKTVEERNLSEAYEAEPKCLSESEATDETERPRFKVGDRVRQLPSGESAKITVVEFCYGIQYDEDGYPMPGRYKGNELEPIPDLPSDHIDLLRRTLEAVWADAYTYGWSDGTRGDDPNARDNPYSEVGSE